MTFNVHSRLEGQHAFLSPSKYHWINYDDEKLVSSYRTHTAAERGVRLHQFAEDAISLGIKLPRTRNALNLYVNDVIGFKMETEQPLYYSDNCFGTADAISFRKNVLRIFDYKSGVTKASMTQLETYAALFCLEYGHSPQNIEIELRIYQLDEAVVHFPEPDDILYIMDRIMFADKIVDQLKMEG